MCRITGIFDLRAQPDNHLDITVARMRDTLAHGGPDDQGAWVSADLPLALGHRRLSIIDLSEGGHQPMTANAWVIAFNGEIYNYQEIRTELEALGYSFRTHSDTEVVLHGFDAWGEALLPRCRGMFAFALWNTATRKLTLCRDRMGVKPLYWYYKDGLFLFASELKAFHQHPDFDTTLNKDAISLFLQQGYIHSPHCIYAHAGKVPAASVMTIDALGNRESHPYWSAESAYKNAQLIDKPEAEICDELEALLMESFQLRMVADVPVGLFLSGGIDSSLVTALLQKNATQPLKTFTIGFDDPAKNEAPHARAVADYLGTDHTELICTEQDFVNALPLLPELYDEPFGDNSGIPTLLVSAMAREQVTVSLSADGGDEIFGGYTKYEASIRFFQKLRKLPAPARMALQAATSAVSPAWISRNGPKLPVLKNYTDLGNKYAKFKQAVHAKDIVSFFNQASVYITPKDQLKLFPHFTDRFHTDVVPDPQRMISYLGLVDMMTYLEGDIMAKVDRATMRVALEGREPFLDHKIIEYAFGLADHYKIRGKETKYILRQILYKYVPREIIERPKQGFNVPIEAWLRTLLADELKALANDQNFAADMYFDPLELQAIISAFLKPGKRYINANFVWFLYNLYAWWKAYQRKS